MLASSPQSSPSDLPIVKPRAWPVFAGFAAAGMALAILINVLLIGWGVFKLLTVPGVLEDIQTGTKAVELVNSIMASPKFTLACIALTAVILLFTAMLGAMLSGENLGTRLRTGRSGLTASGIAAAQLGFFALGIAGGAVGDFAGWGRQGAVVEFLRTLTHASGPFVALTVLGVGLLGPVSEEVFYRGYMQSRLSRCWGSWPAIFVTASLFGLSHFDWFQSSCAFLFGIFLGWLAERTRSIRSTVAAHCSYNVIVTLASWHGIAFVVPPVHVTGIIFGASLIVFLASVAALRNQKSIQHQSP